ncbi:hypothetical protein MIR68_004858 [Amoeboaphelidium protococcarum]|nr:hypothetical protein MIR68_004858 [Amoeboaphelidium protococcarum]
MAGSVSSEAESDYNEQEVSILPDDDFKQISRGEFEQRILNFFKQNDSVQYDEKEQILIPQLKQFQIDGVKWLINLRQVGLNGILADEQGLGKTIQSIAYIQWLTSQRIITRSLIVVPLSVLRNWMEEMVQFAPQLTCIAYHGSKEVRAQQMGNLENAQVIVTSYEMVLLDYSVLSRLQLDFLCVDEAQRLKNDQSKTFQMLDSLNIKQRLLLTGTPIQNNLVELYSLLKFLNPQLVSHVNSKVFVQWYKDDLNSLKLLTDKVMLRRTKRQVLTLPRLQEVVLECGMSDLQRDLYRSILKQDISLIVHAYQYHQKSTQSLNNTLIQLRKCVSHPYLFIGVEKEPFELGVHLVETSGKLLALDSLLDRLKLNGHRVLIFCQMTSMLDILQDYMDYRQYEYERLDGSIRGQDRFQVLDRYKTKSPFVFLLSTRAGGVGLNLVNADTVIFYDIDHNPQMDLQAAARAHRIGQSKEVTVIKLICKGTVDEIIYRRGQSKLQLSRSLLDDHDDEIIDGTGDAERQSLNLSEIVTFGAEQIMEDDKSTQIADHEDLSTWIDNLLHQRGPSQQDDEQQSCSTSQPDSMYVYEGKDYSGERKMSAQNLIDLAAQISVQDPRSNNKSDYNQLLENERLLRRIAAEEKKQKKLRKLWDDNDYISLRIADQEILNDITELCDEKEIVYVNGDVTRPRGDDNCIIVHSVDDSGRWSRFGLFRSLSQLSPIIQEKYLLAYQIKDLHFGDVHCIPIGSHDDHPQIYVALVVAQKRLRNDQVSDIDLDVLNTALQRVCSFAIQHNASVHLPRFGQSIHVQDWYKAERIIRKSITSRGVQAFVYYYSRKQSAPDSSC